MKLSELLYFTEHETGAVVNIHAIHPAFYSGDRLDLAPEQYLHRGSYCEFAKRHGRTEAVSCPINKARSRQVAQLGRPFAGCCPFGVWELAWPVRLAAEHAATVYLGHLGTHKLRQRIGNTAYDGAPLRPRESVNRRELRRAAAFIAEFIRTEIRLWDASGNRLHKQKPGTFYRDYCIRYIEACFRDNIQLQDMAATLRMSPNYLSARIRQECGQTFSQLLNDKRLQVARTYLEFEPRYRVTDIAFMCGFRDSNYFSTVFSKRFGISPREYRRREHPTKTIA